MRILTEEERRMPETRFAFCDCTIWQVIGAARSGTCPTCDAGCVSPIFHSHGAAERAFLFTHDYEPFSGGESASIPETKVVGRPDSGADPG